jgi:hypothetical protein
MNELFEQLAIDCAGQLEWDFPKPPASFTFNREELTKFYKCIVYDVLSELTNDDSLGSPRIDTIRRLAERYGVANNE